MNFDRSKRLFEEGQKNLVGAVNSPVRAYKSVGGTPLFIKKAKGSKIIDVDNNQYIDLVLSYGTMILGHRPKKIEKSIVKALKNGYTFGATSTGEIELAKIICDAFPNMDKVRFVNSGTEAVLSALRLARAFTNKNKIIKFSGCYNGHTDALLVAAGSGLATLSLPGSSGVPKEAVQNTLIAEYNNIEKVKNNINKNTCQITNMHKGCYFSKYIWIWCGGFIYRHVECRSHNNNKISQYKNYEYKNWNI